MRLHVVCRLPLYACLLLAACLGAAEQTVPSMKVWAVGDYVRIDPLSNKAFEVNPLLFTDGLTGDYSAKNLVWDGAKQTLSLKAARNEIAAFQIVIERVGDAKLTNVNVKLGDLVGPGGTRIPIENIDLYKEWYVQVKNRSKQNYSLGTGWYPDGLIPCLRWSGNLFPNTFILPFEIPDLLNNISPKQTSQALWVDIYVPRDRQSAPPGTYTSSITVSSDFGKVDLNLDLSVWDFALPEASHLRGNIHTDTEINIFAPELELKYYQLIRRHRIAMGVLGYAPGLKVTGSNLEFDWTKYDGRLSRYLDGRAFTKEFGYSGPGYGIPIELLVLPFDADPINDYYDSRHPGEPYGKEWKFYRPWPVDLPKQGPTPQYAEIWKKTFKAYQEHFDQHPEWNRTTLVVFLLSLDESYDDASIDRMLYYGKLLKESGANRLKYRIDGWYPPETMKRLEGYVDIAILGLPEYDPEKVNPLKKTGLDPWFYTGVGMTDGDLLQCRALSWIAWKYAAGSWTIWELDWNALHAWQTAETHGNGGGFFVYRGETMGLDEPVASIRLKQLRRGSQDYEYFWLLDKQGNGWRELANSAVNSIIHNVQGEESAMGSPGMWNHNPEEWERARIRIGERLSGAVK
jgi:Domain of unknown function (DUF4091)